MMKKGPSYKIDEQALANFYECISKAPAPFWDGNCVNEYNNLVKPILNQKNNSSASPQTNQEKTNAAPNNRPLRLSR